MPPPLPPLSAVRCFEAAARHQSFTRAAEELGMTQAAVSYQIKILEDRIGKPLFRRGPRGVTLTEAGKQLAPTIADSFARLRGAFAELDQTAARRLSITTLSSLATSWLVPRLGTFQSANPDVAVTLDTSQAVVDFAQSDFDVGLRTGKGEWPGLVAHHMFAPAFSPMLSPVLAKRLTRRPNPADLLALPLIDPHDPWWGDWFGEIGVDIPDLAQRPGFRGDNQYTASRAALSGQGVAILMPRFFKDELATGQLIQPFPLVKKTDAYEYWLVYPEARKRSRTILAFRDWVLGEAAKD